MEIGIAKVFKEFSPTRRFAGHFDGVLEAHPLALANHTEPSAAVWFDGGMNGPERGRLVWNPVERVEGYDEVELAIERKMPCISDCELQIGVTGSPVFFREVDHVGRGVYAKHRAPRDARG